MLLFFSRMRLSSLSSPRTLLRLRGELSSFVGKRTISSSGLTIEHVTDKSRFDHRPAKEDLVFGTTMSDHMLTVEWNTTNGWESPKVIPYQHLSLSPAASSLHYGKFIVVL